LKGYKINNPNKVVLFYGVCNLCNGTISLLIRLDKRGVLRFSSLQSEFSKSVFKNSNINPTKNFDTVVFIKDSQIFYHSNAVLQIFRELAYPWKVLYVIKYVPVKLRDRIYKFIAKNRYDWFGRRTDCMVPTEEIRKRCI